MTTYNFQALFYDDTGGFSFGFSEAYGLNRFGEVAGHAIIPEVTGTQTIGLLWVHGTVDPSLTSSPGWQNSQSVLYSVNDSGDAVGVRAFDFHSQIPILVRGGVPTDLAAALGVGALGVGVNCTDINNSGVLCGGANAFAYDTFANKLTPIPLPTLTDHYNQATAINQAGHVVGIVQHNDDSYSGFFYDGALHDLGPTQFVADINDKGQVVGSIEVDYPARYSPTIWDVTSDPPTTTSIPLPTSDAFIGAHAEAINNQGMVVGSCWTAASWDVDPTAFVYSNGRSTDLNTLIPATGWRLRVATDINDAGMVTGIGSFDRGSGPVFPGAFLLTPISQAQRGMSVPQLVATLIFGGVTVGGGGWVVVGSTPIPVGPRGPAEGWNLLSSSKRDALIGMALDEVAKYITDANVRELVRSAILEGVRTSVGQLSAGGGMQVEMAYPRPAVTQLIKGKTPLALRRFETRRPPT